MQKQKILILFAHPKLEKSHVNLRLLEEIPKDNHITFHDLYECYADFNIDAEREKELLLAHDIIIWQHPFYWYSCPPLLKQWIDIVLEFGWAYGPEGTALKGKIIFNAITTGGSKEAYSHEGRNKYTIQELLAPFNQTARLCHMIYLPPFAVQGTHRLSNEQLEKYSVQYKVLLEKLSNRDLDINKISSLNFLNEMCLSTIEELQK